MIRTLVLVQLHMQVLGSCLHVGKQSEARIILPKDITLGLQQCCLGMRLSVGSGLSRASMLAGIPLEIA